MIQNIYFLLSILTLLYYRLLARSLPPEVKYIVVLSASSKFLTKHRLKASVHLKMLYPKAKLIACGKEMSDFMKDYLKDVKVEDVVFQNKSTNTYEDAVFSKKYIDGNENLVLVTHPSHARRSLHTFQRVFSGKIYLYTTSILLSLDSFLLPSGWIASLINLAKDFRYNRKV